MQTWFKLPLPQSLSRLIFSLKKTFVIRGRMLPAADWILLCRLTPQPPNMPQRSLQMLNQHEARSAINNVPQILKALLSAEDHGVSKQMSAPCSNKGNAWMCLGFSSGLQPSSDFGLRTEIPR